MTRESYAPDREAGVDFAGLDDALSDQEFPARGRELIEEHGDHRLRHQHGTERFGDLFDPLAEQTYESPGEVHQAVLSVIGDHAVGRKGYSDRDPSPRDEPAADDRAF